MPSPLEQRVSINFYDGPWKELIDLSTKIWERSEPVEYLDLLKESGWLIPVNDPRVLRKVPRMFLDENEEGFDVVASASDPPGVPSLRSMTGFSNDGNAEDDFVDAREGPDSLSLYEEVQT